MSINKDLARIDTDAELTARCLSEQENAQDRGLDDEAVIEAAVRATLAWDRDGRPE